MFNPVAKHAHKYNKCLVQTPKNKKKQKHNDDYWEEYLQLRDLEEKDPLLISTTTEGKICKTKH